MREPSGLTWKTSEDAAKRFADAVRLHQQIIGLGGLITVPRFMAVRIADGGSDGVAYDSRPAAIIHNTNNPSRCFYPQIPPEPWSPMVCDRLLWYARSAYDNGVREDEAHQLILPTRVEDMLADMLGEGRQ